jgi:hypothetical protein
MLPSVFRSDGDRVLVGVTGGSALLTAEQTVELISVLSAQLIGMDH